MVCFYQTFVVNDKNDLLFLSSKAYKGHYCMITCFAQMTVFSKFRQGFYREDIVYQKAADAFFIANGNDHLTIAIAEDLLRLLNQLYNSRHI